MSKEMYYFGCIGELGHHWFPHKPRNAKFRNVIDCIDGLLRVYDVYEQKVGNYVTLTFPDGMIIVHWPDNSVDTRPGSNSNLVAFGYDSPEEIITDAYNKFPKVMNRQARPTPLFKITTND